MKNLFFLFVLFVLVPPPLNNSKVFLKEKKQ